MRQDLRTASGSLGRVRRFSYREHLERVEPLLHPAEKVQVLAPGWWGGRRSLVVLTASRLLLVRQHAAGSSAGQAVFVLRDLTHLTVQAASSAGARFRLAVGAEAYEFTVEHHGPEVEQTLRLAMP